MTRPSELARRRIAGGLVAAALLVPFWVEASQDAASAPAPARASPAATSKPKPPRSSRMATKAREHYRAAWGVDALRVSRVASGNLIRFDFRVTDPEQAAPLVDKASSPVLHAPRANALLSVPVMEKIGPLRQTGALKAGQEYWVTFSNKGDLVRTGDRVDVIIGRFHADGLMVE